MKKTAINVMEKPFVRSTKWMLSINHRKNLSVFEIQLLISQQFKGFKESIVKKIAPLVKSGAAIEQYKGFIFVYVVNYQQSKNQQPTNTQLLIFEVGNFRPIANYLYMDENQVRLDNLIEQYYWVSHGYNLDRLNLIPNQI